MYNNNLYELKPINSRQASFYKNLCQNKVGHSIRRWFISKSNVPKQVKAEIKEKLKQEEALYNQLDIRFYNHGYVRCIATAYNN